MYLIYGVQSNNMYWLIKCVDTLYFFFIRMQTRAEWNLKSTSFNSNLHKTKIYIVYNFVIFDQILNYLSFYDALFIIYFSES